MVPVFLAALGAAAIHRQSDPVVLAFTPSKGDRYRYESRVDLTIDNAIWVSGVYKYELAAHVYQPAQFGLIRWVESAVFDSGILDTNLLWTDDKAAHSGMSWADDTVLTRSQIVRDAFIQTFEFAKKTQISFEHSTMGRRISTSPDGPTDLGSVFNLSYADRPVKVGDSWTYQMPGYEGNWFNVTFSLRALSDTQAQISATIVQPNKAIETTEPYWYVIDRKTGRPISAKGTVRFYVNESTVDLHFEERMIPVDKR